MGIAPTLLQVTVKGQVVVFDHSAQVRGATRAAPRRISTHTHMYAVMWHTQPLDLRIPRQCATLSVHGSTAMHMHMHMHTARRHPSGQRSGPAMPCHAMPLCCCCPLLPRRALCSPLPR